MADVLERLDRLEQTAHDRLEACSSLEELDEFRIDYLGRNGEIRDVFESMDEVPEEKRPEVGRRANELKSTLESRFEERRDTLRDAAADDARRASWLDVTLPGRTPRPGGPHPVTTALRDIVDVFTHLGFRPVEGPEVETDWYNFEALNIPPDHPARDMHDTFYLEDDRLLRTHTSPVQIRVMEDHAPPLRILSAGRVYRRDADRTHSPMFHQVEGLWVDDTVTFDQLKGTLELFVRRFFGPDIDMRFRPSYFPFTEPSAEIDISFADGEDEEWLEVLGAGMVDPAVFEAVDYDPGEVQGFAFGLGVERLAMLRYGIDNLPLLFENDLRFLEQF